MAGGDVTAEVFVFNVDVPRDELLRRLSGRPLVPDVPVHLPRLQQPAARRPAAATATAPR